MFEWIRVERTVFLHWQERNHEWICFIMYAAYSKSMQIIDQLDDYIKKWKVRNIFVIIYFSIFNYRRYSKLKF